MYRLIVQSAVHKVRTREQLGSKLFTEWHWSPKYYSVNPDTIVSPCFVISCKHDDTRILEALSYDDWANHFIKSTHG